MTTNWIWAILLVLAMITGITDATMAKEIKKEKNLTLTGIPGIIVGHYTDAKSLRGCTVIRFPAEGATAAVDVRGAAPGTRETDLLDPINFVQKVHAIVFSGGSAYGLDSASGVMSYLEEKGIGFDVGDGLVIPIVPAAVLFDLKVGDPRIRPDKNWGHIACRKATGEPVAEGNVGAGTGATVGKLLGMKRAIKSGLGSSLIKLPDGGLVGALVAVNAVGDIIAPGSGNILAGIRGDQKGTFTSSVEVLLNSVQKDILPGTNTTIGLVATNFSCSKSELKKIAQMAHDGMARAINPVHTMYDGDTVFAVSVPSLNSSETGSASADINMIGTAAAQAMSKAIINAINSAESVSGYPSAKDWGSISE